MAVLENGRHELFAQELAKGKTATEAYILAGFKPSRTNAARLRANERIGERVREIQAAGAKSAEVSVASLLDELEAARTKATTLGQLSAAVRASVEKGRLAGLLVERQQVELNASINDPALECETTPELCRHLADERLDSLTNSRWLPISEQDRQQLADLFAGWSDAIEAFVAEVNSRPLIHTRKIEPQALLTNGRKR